MEHCTNCGEKLVQNREFCTGCGQSVQQIEKTTPSRVKRKGPFTKPMNGIALFILIALLVGSAFYIGGKYSSQKPSDVSNDSALETGEVSTKDGKSEANQNKAKEEPQETSEAKPASNQESTLEKNDSNAEMKTLDIDSAMNELNNIEVYNVKLIEDLEELYE